MCAVLVTETDADRAMSLYQTLLEAVFDWRGLPPLTRSGDAPEQPRLVAADLDDRQRRVVAAIAASDAAWSYGNVILTLMEYGLGHTRDRAEFTREFAPELLGPTADRAGRMGFGS